MEFTLFGVALGVIALSIAKAVQSETGLGERYVNYLRAALMGGAYLLYTMGPDLAAQYPWFEGAVVLWGGFVVVVLTVLGYWPQLARIGARIQGK